MRIGQNHNFLLIERVPLEGGYSACRVEAVAASSGRNFSASNSQVFFDGAVNALFSDFEELKSHEIKIPLTEGGWLHLVRDAKGYITLHYRIGCWKTHTAMEGQIIIEGEFTNGFCRELKSFFES